MWFVCKKKQPAALMRIYCFPYAGGDGGVVFRKWESDMPPYFEIHVLHLPGRGRLTSEPYETDVRDVARKLAIQIENQQSANNVPFVFVGYSLGCLISYEVCKALSCSVPLHCFFAGHVAPNYFDAEHSLQPKIHQLSDEHFRLALQRYNMVDYDLLQDEDFAAYFLPIIRADLQLDETYIYDGEEIMVDSGLTLISGGQDIAAPSELMLEWERFFNCEKPTTHLYKELGHEFIIYKSSQLRELITKEICLKYIRDPWPKTLIEKSRITPDLRAVSQVIDGKVIHQSMADFVAEAQGLASWMYEVANVRPGDTVLLVGESCYEAFLSMLCFGLMGVIYAPSPPDMRMADFENRVSNLEPTLILLCEELSLTHGEKNNADEPYEFIIFHDIGYKEFIGNGRYAEIGYEDVSLLDICFVAHTSGSTGLPKAVPISHRNVLNNIQWRGYSFPMTSNDDCYGISIFWFWYFMYPLINGYRIAPIPSSEMLDLSTYLHKMELLNVTHIEVSPTYASLMADIGGGHPALKNLSFCVLMGEVVELRVIKKFQKVATACRITNIYSLTETNDITACIANRKFIRHMEENHSHLTAAPIGTLAWNVNVWMQRTDGSMIQLHDLLEITQGNEECEMYVGGDELTISGYLNNPKANEKSIITAPNGEKIFKCNDLCWIMEKDPVVLVVTGRADRTVNVRGTRVGLDRVAGIVKQLDEVKDCTIIWNFDYQQLVCFLVTSTGDDSELDLIRGQLMNSLTSAETPSRYMVLDKLPLNKRTKVDVKRLKQMLIEDQLKDNKRDFSSDPTIAKIEKIWVRLLQNSDFGLDDDFFNVGGHSLLAVQLASELKLPVPEVMDKRTIREQAQLMKETIKATNTEFILELNVTRDFDTKIAVVGLSGRWPMAVDKYSLWNHLVQGADCFTDLTDNEMLQAGVPRELFMKSNWVRRAAVIPPEVVECFDAKLFNMSEKEARYIDPNQRVMLEMCFECLEDAGYAPFNAGNVGVYANGAALPTYLQNCLKHEIGDITMIQLTDPGAYVQLELGNDKDYGPTRVSYCLNLTGPAKNIQTACSSGLSCVAEAVDALRAGRCEMALAGGISITCPMKTGYLYQEGMVFSKDGRVRPFDANASGTMFTNGGTVVCLKRLEDAIKDKDHIYSVIHGIADNNDGHRGKKAYAAPSVYGQSECIAKAYNDARIHPRDVTYLELHGTGTLVGDPIEIEGLKKVFGAVEEKIAIGSMKANIGHANSAAGICSFGKLQLMFENVTICPQLYFETPNPGINFDEVPFYAPKKQEMWYPNSEGNRIAGISSFGMGGSNVHAVCGGFQQPPTSYGLPSALINLSANSENSLKEMQKKLSKFLEERGDSLSLGDISFTLSRGRTEFDNRIGFVASSVRDLIQQLKNNIKLNSGIQNTEKPAKVVFVCPGQGAQYADCGAGLFHNFPFVENIIQEAISILGYDFRTENLNTTKITQVSVYIHSYCTWMILKSLGVEPVCALGHSVGEVAAATCSGLMSFAEGLRLIHLRGGLMDMMEEGKMCATFGTEEQVNEVIAELPDVAIACYNAPKITVISGPGEQVRAASDILKEKKIKNRVLDTAAAFHSKSITQEMMHDLSEYCATVDFKDTEIPLLSNVTGDWISAEELKSPEYWAQHMRNPVRFSQQIESLKKKYSDDKIIFVECGPGKSMNSLIKRCGITDLDWHLTHTMRHPKAKTDDVTQIFECISALWTHGINLKLDNLFEFDFGVTDVRRISLPTYCFERKHCWVGPSDLNVGSKVVYEKQLENLAENSNELLNEKHEGKNFVYSYGSFTMAEDPFNELENTIFISNLEELQKLLEANEIQYLWYVGCNTDDPTLKVSQDFLQFIHLLTQFENKMDLAIVCPWKNLHYSGVWGMAKTLILEQGNLNVKLIETDGSLNLTSGVMHLEENEFCFQNSFINVPRLAYADAPAKMRELDSDGWYLITGGTRGLGFGLAQHLANEHGIKKMILVGRRDPPASVSDEIEVLRKNGVQIEIFKCDITQESYEIPNHDEILGIFHCAGALRDALIMNTKSQDLDIVFNVKLAIEYLLSSCPNVQFTVLFSSTSSLFGAGGQVSYSGANTYLDWLSEAQGLWGHSGDIYSIQWAGWTEIGMSVDTNLKELNGERHIKPSVGYEALDFIISLKPGNYAVMDIVNWMDFSKNLSVFPKHTNLITNILEKEAGKGFFSKKKEEKPKTIAEFIHKLLGTNEKEASLYSLGMDSLDIVNFRNKVQATYDVSLPLVQFMDQNQTLGDLIQKLQKHTE